jgi:hypothetical protein
VRAALADADRKLAAGGEALRTRDARINELERVSARLGLRVIERQRELREVHEELREVREELEETRARAAEDTRAVVALGRQLEEIRSQARGQATRMRLRALRDAAELSDRITELAKRPGDAGARLIEALEETVRRLGDGADEVELGAADGTMGTAEAGVNGRPAGSPDPADLFEGLIHVEVGPLSDFSQLVLFEDAARSIAATSEISIKRFSEGRATMAVQLREPVALLRELEERCDLEFKVRDMRRDRVILDVDGSSE